MLHDKLEKLMAKKGPSKLSENEKNAKMGVLHDLKSMAADAMGKTMEDGIKPMSHLKKATVVASDDKGLQEGLKKAHDLVTSTSEDHSASDSETQGNPMEEAADHVEDEEGYHAEPSGFHPPAMKEMGHDGEHDDGSEEPDNSHEPEESEEHLNAKLADYQKKLDALKRGKKK